MNTSCLAFVVAIFAIWPHFTCAQPRPLSVCEALNSAANRQPVSIYAAIATTRHGTYIFEGTGTDPCPGWPSRFFTAPSAIPLFLGPYSGVQISDRLVREYLNFSQHMRAIQNSEPSKLHMVTIGGVIIRKRWPLTLRRADGTYIGFGEGLDGGSAAILVMTSVPILDR